MLQGNYLRRLREDLPKWREKGWVSSEGSAAILTEVGETHSAFSFSLILALFGGLLIGAGIIAFVAANWEEIPRLARFFLLITGMALAYLAAWRLDRARLAVFGDAALLTAGLIFAAAIALIGQSYHLAGEFVDAVLYWNSGIIVAAILCRSRALVALALVGACVWTFTYTVQMRLVPHWEGLGLVLVAVAIAVWVGGLAARICAVLALFFWLTITIIGLADQNHWSFGGTVALLLCVALALWMAGSALASWTEEPGLNGFGTALLWPAMAATLVLTASFQLPYLVNSGRTGGWMALAAVTLLIALLVGSAALLRGEPPLSIWEWCFFSGLARSSWLHGPCRPQVVLFRSK